MQAVRDSVYDRYIKLPDGSYTEKGNTSNIIKPPVHIGHRYGWENAQDIYGMTPLHYAMRAENGDAAMVLLEAGADPNIETYADQGIPLAMIGSIPDRLDVLKAMLDKGADVHHPVKNANMSLLDFMKTYFSDDQSLKPVIALMEQYA